MTPFGAHRLRPFGAARGAGDGPPQGEKQRGQGAGGKPIADAKKCLGHRGVIGAKGWLREGVILSGR